MTFYEHIDYAHELVNLIRKRKGKRKLSFMPKRKKRGVSADRGKFIWERRDPLAWIKGELV